MQHPGRFPAGSRTGFRGFGNQVVCPQLFSDRRVREEFGFEDDEGPVRLTGVVANHASQHNLGTCQNNVSFISGVLGQPLHADAFSPGHATSTQVAAQQNHMEKGKGVLNDVVDSPSDHNFQWPPFLGLLSLKIQRS